MPSKPQQFIVIPLSDYTSQSEIKEILADLGTFSFSHDPYLVQADEIPAPTVVDEVLTIRTADGKTVREGDRVFSHYTCTWGVITKPREWGGDGVWFDFVQDGGKSDLLNGDRICTVKPAWMSK